MYEQIFVNVRLIIVIMQLRAALTRFMKVSYVIGHERASSLILFHNCDVRISLYMQCSILYERRFASDYFAGYLWEMAVNVGLDVSVGNI